MKWKKNKDEYVDNLLFVAFWEVRLAFRMTFKSYYSYLHIDIIDIICLLKILFNEWFLMNACMKYVYQTRMDTITIVLGEGFFKINPKTIQLMISSIDWNAIFYQYIVDVPIK